MFLFKNVVLICVGASDYWVGCGTCLSADGGPKITRKSLFSSTLWVLGIQLKFGGKCLDPLRHFAVFLFSTEGSLKR